MNPPEPGDVELDLLLLNAKTSTLHVLNTAVDIGAGLAAIQARHERGTASRPPPARAGPGPAHEPAHKELDPYDKRGYGTEGNLP